MGTTDIDRDLFERQGYLAGLQVFTEDECPRLFGVYQRLRALLPPGMSTQEMDWWHGQDRELWEICTHPKILDAVEAVLGPDFYLWSTQFFVKDAGDGRTAPWHQDAYYFPLSPRRAVTAWLAFTDSGEENGAMMVVPGSHRGGRLKHRTAEAESDLLGFELEQGTFRESDAVPLILKAGQISLHDDGMIHGSGPNRSERLRCGFTMRFSPGDVRCDLSVWPFFKAYWMRGEDRWHRNPVGTPPEGEMTRYVQVSTHARKGRSDSRTPPPPADN